MLILAVIIFLLALAAVSSGIIRTYRTHLVVGGSMEPTIHYGDIVIVKSMPGSAARPGDIILFKTSGSGNPVLHRLVSTDADTGCITTKGDANAEADPDCAQLVAGKAVLWFPRVGLPIIWLSRLVQMTFGRAA